MMIAMMMMAVATLVDRRLVSTRVRCFVTDREGDRRALQSYNIDFYSTPSRGRVYKWKFCLSVCATRVRHHFFFFSLFRLY